MENEHELEPKIMQYMGKAEVTEKLRDAANKNLSRVELNMDSIRKFDEGLYTKLKTSPLTVIPMIESQIKSLMFESSDRSSQKTKSSEKTTKQQERPPKVSFTGAFGGDHFLTPRGLVADVVNNLVCTQGVVTRLSIVRPKLENSAHYCEETRTGFIKDYTDQYSLKTSKEMLKLSGQEASFTGNSVPTKDNNNNPLSFEYGFSTFRDFQIAHVQEPPERTPIGQLPRSVEVVLEDDLVDRVKPGDRVQVTGVFKAISSEYSKTNGVFRNVLIACNIISFNAETDNLKISGYELGQMKNIAKRDDCLDLLSNSLAPSIYGHDWIKKACILQLLGGAEKNLENGTHLRGDINVLLIGDPSTAKSQFLRHMMSTAQNAINTTGRGSSGVGLTAAVVMDKDTGERHLEAGAMVLGDRGLVCIDEFDKMSDLDRVAIHEVMEQQTVTIAKAGIHCSLNARCSVLAAANPIYGEYQTDLAAAKNIGLPDSLLSRFDFVFIVLDEQSSRLDRLIADRVVRNHMFPSDTPTLLSAIDDRIVEPDINSEERNDHTNEVFEKDNHLLHGKGRKQILKKQFLKKYIQFAKIGPNKSPPVLTEEASIYIINEWTKLRTKQDEEINNKLLAVPITVRTLETLIRIATAHAKLKLAKNVTKNDCEMAMNILNFALFGEEPENSENVIMSDDDRDSKKKRKTDKSGEKRKRDQDDPNSGKNSKSSDKSLKKSKVKKQDEDSESIEKIFESKVDINSAVSEEQKKFVFKALYTMSQRETKQIKINDLWKEIITQNKKELCKDVSQLLDIILALENDNKALYISDSKEVILI